MAEYRSALSVFSDETLTHVYNLMLGDDNDDVNTNGNNGSNSEILTKEQDSDEVNQTGNGDRDDTTKNANNNHEELVELYQKCKDSALKIAKMEASPGFLQSSIFAKNNNPSNRHHHNLNNHMKINSSLNNHSFSRTQSRRTTSSSGSGSGVGSLTGNKNMCTHSSMIPSKRKGSFNINTNGLKKQQNLSKVAPVSKDYNDNGHNNVNPNQGNIPASALSFLAALNAKKNSTLDISSTPNLPKNSQILAKKGRKRMSAAKNDSDEDEHEYDEEKEESEEDSFKNDSESNDENCSGRKNPPRIQIRKEVKSKKRKNTNNDDHEDVLHEAQKKPKVDINKNDKDSQQTKKEEENRLRGRADVVYDVGDLVAVYFEKDDQWYEATIKEVSFKVQAGEELSSKNENCASQRARRAQKRQAGGKDNKEARNEDHNEKDSKLRVDHYSIEYDDGEIEEYVSPENVMDRLDEEQ